MRRSPRVHRVADRIQVELADILQTRMKDPRHGFFTVTEVEMADDLRSARIFISTLPTEELEATLATLDHAKGFLRTELGRRLQLRHTPELHFRPDRSAEHAMRVSEILRDLEEKGEFAEGGESEEE